MKKLLLLGAGGHAKVVSDAALAMGLWQDIFFLSDDETDLSAKTIGNLSEIARFKKEFSDAFVAIGDNKKRENFFLKLKELGFNLPVIIHPRAFVAKGVEVASSSVVLANAVINKDAKIGFASIINSGAIIEHDCVIGDFVHISPGAVLAGGVRVGAGSWVGIGARVIEKISLGSNVMVGAGSVVIDDICDNFTVVGVPARSILR